MPPDLRSAAAGIEAERGTVQEAIRQMRALVEDEPMYYPGWNRLADWYQATGSGDGLLEAAQAMVRLAPQHAPAFGYLSETKLLNNDRDGAKEALRQAMSLAPDYGYAGLTLFDLLLADGDLRGAVKTLDVLRTQVGGDVTLLREVQLAVKRKNHEIAEKSLRQLCFSTTEDPGLIRTAAISMQEGGWDNSLYRVFDDIVSQPGVNPEVGALWIKLRFGRADCEPRLDALKGTGELWRRASAAYLEVLGHSQLAEPVHKYLPEHEEALREDSPTWATIGAIFLEIGAFQAAVDWMSDWRSRSDLAPWMLWNYTLALRHLKRDADAYEVGKQALLLRDDVLSGNHKLMLSLDEILAGDIAAADTLFEELDISGYGEWRAFLYAVLSELIGFHRSLPDKKGESAAVTRRLVRLAKESSFFWRDSLLIRLHRRAILSIARADGSIVARARAIGRLLYLKAITRFRDADSTRI